MIRQVRRIVAMASALVLLVTPAIVRSAELDANCSRGPASVTICKIHVPSPGRCETKLTGENADGSTFRVVLSQRENVVDGQRQMPISTCLVCKVDGIDGNSADLRTERMDNGTQSQPGKTGDALCGPGALGDTNVLAAKSTEGATLSAEIDSMQSAVTLRALLRSCGDCRLAGKDMHGIDLRGIRMVGADLHGVNLAGAQLSGVSFTGVNLDDADLSNADLRNARFIGGSLRGTKLSGAHLDGVTFNGVSLQRASIVDGRPQMPVRSCLGCNLNGIDLSSADLRSIRFAGGHFAGATLARSDLRDSWLVAANLSKADLSGAKLSGAIFVGADMRDSNGRGADFGIAQLCGPNGSPYFSSASSPGGATVCADLRGADLHGADLSQVRWCDQDRANCRMLTRAELVDFAHADLAGASAPP